MSMDMQEPTFSIRNLVSRFAPRGVVVPSGALPFMFGNTPALAHTLASLVAQGQKTATAGLLWAWEADDGGPPQVGQVYVVHNWEGLPVALIENTHVSIVPFNRVDAQFAREEGEGDRSLAWWRRTHWHYFAAECRRVGREPSEDMPIVCQRFRLLYPQATHAWQCHHGSAILDDRTGVEPEARGVER
jgi:uncharacterized protein YhfF